MAAGACAQEPPASSGTFYRPQRWGVPESFRFNGQPETPPPAAVQPTPAITRCAVPLLQMQPPDAVDPAIQFVPRTDKVDPMPSAKLPPACDAATPQ